jgi:hypothetical protein
MFIPTSSYGAMVIPWHSLFIHLAYGLRGLWLITGGIESPRDVAMNTQRQKRANTGKM